MLFSFDFSGISDNIVYFMIGRYPKGTLGGLGLTIYLAVASCILSFFGGLVLGLMNISQRWYLKYPTKIFIHVIRGCLF